MRSYPIHLQRQEVAADGEGDPNPEVFSVGSHRELAPSYMTVRQRIRSAPAEESHGLLSAPNTAQNLPEPLIPAVVSTSDTDRLNIPPVSGYSLATAALSDDKKSSAAEEALIPSSIRFIYPTSTTASATTSSSVTGVSRLGGVNAAAAPPIPSRPADRGKDQSHITAPPKPAQRTKFKSESDASGNTLQANSSSVSARPPVIPPRVPTQQQQHLAQAAGGSPQSQQKAKKRPMPPPRKAINPGPNDSRSTAVQLSPKIYSPQHTNTGFSDSEIRIQTLILSDPEFQSCTPEVCMQALKKHKYEVDAAREEIRVHMLMEMQMAHITTEDCRRALSHCQQKTDRAAAWLLEQSDDIERRRQ